MKRGQKIQTLIKKEERRQRQTISLIPSENFVSKEVRSALGSVLSNKYAEGKSRQRYYFGNRVMDEIEDRTKGLALKVFRVSGKDWSVNVQPYSGSIANLAVYLGLLEPGDKILAMSLEHGGHLTHGHKVSWTGKLFSFHHYGVERNGRLDYKKIAALAKKIKPKLIVCGATAYSRTLDFKEFGRIAKSVKAILMADMAHIAGLVAGGIHPSPFKYADVVTTTTHKTLRGPRGAIIFSRKEFSDSIDRAVFPGLQGGPHLNIIGAIGICLEEAIKPEFKKYARQIVENSKTLSLELKKRKYSLVTGGTDNHLCLVDVTPLGLTGKKAGELLEQAGIVVNKNMIPFDARTPFDPSGIRLGTPSVTTRGMKEKEMKIIARLIDETIRKTKPFPVLAREVQQLARKFIYHG